MENQKPAAESAGVFSKVKSIVEDGIEDVYCLNVPEFGNFVVNEGIVVKNCLDSLRYAIFTHLFAKPIQSMGINELERIKAEAFGGGDNLPEFFKDPREYPQNFRPLI